MFYLYFAVKMDDARHGDESMPSTSKNQNNGLTPTTNEFSTEYEQLKKHCNSNSEKR